MLNITFLFIQEKGEKIPLFAAKYLQEKIIGTSENDQGSILNWITDQFSAVLGGTAANDFSFTICL